LFEKKVLTNEKNHGMISSMKNQDGISFISLENPEENGKFVFRSIKDGFHRNN
jgi:hypothetical protein